MISNAKYKYCICYNYVIIQKEVYLITFNRNTE